MRDEQCAELIPHFAQPKQRERRSARVVLMNN
jgi:hypothetical protein